jgi:polyisoprenoid-binding protein YceI
VTIDATSLSTGFGPLDDHVKNADFLEVEAHPTIRFTSSSVTRTGDTTADVAGDLVVRGVAVPTTLKVDLTHQGAHPLAQFIDYYQGDWLAFRATGEIDTSSLGFALPVGTLVVDISSELKAE